MKQFYKYILPLLLIAFLQGSFLTSNAVSFANEIESTGQSASDTASSKQNEAYISIKTIDASNNGYIRTTNSQLNPPFRVNSKDDITSTIGFIQKVQYQTYYKTGYTTYCRLTAQQRETGHYLYALCKLII